MRTLSIVVELENVRHAGEDGCRRMLRAVGGEVRALSSGAGLAAPVELFVCLDPAKVEPARCRALVDEALNGDRGLFDLEFLALDGAEYYEMKNEGAACASGDLIVFIDSDAVPRPGWLPAMLAPFQDPDVAVVAGNTYVEPVSLYSRALALTWFFGLRATTSEVRPTSRFFANNLAFRREVQRRFPFPSMRETSRGSGPTLAALLVSRGIGLVYAPAAQVTHLPPKGWANFLARAMARGRDRALLAPSGSSAGRLGWLHGPARHLGSDLGRNAGRLIEGRREVGLTRRALPAAYGIGAAFAVCSAVGEAATIVRRELMVRHFRI